MLAYKLINDEWRKASSEDDSWMPQIHERFARAIEAAATATAPLLERIAGLERQLEQAKSALKGCVGVLEQADCSTGYCCCGSSTESHGLGDGHSPVDAGDYYCSQALEAARAAIQTGGAPPA